jgi:hypothetical protein
MLMSKTIIGDRKEEIIKNKEKVRNTQDTHISNTHTNPSNSGLSEN